MVESIETTVAVIKRDVKYLIGRFKKLEDNELHHLKTGQEKIHKRIDKMVWWMVGIMTSFVITLIIINFIR